MSTSNWRERLKAALIEIDASHGKSAVDTDTIRAQTINYLQTVVIPAYEELKPVFAESGRQVRIIEDFEESLAAIIEIRRDKEMELIYAATINYNPVQLQGRFYILDPETGEEEDVGLGSESGYFIHNIKKDMVIESVVDEYSAYVNRM